MKHKIKVVKLSTVFIITFLISMFIFAYVLYKIDPNIKTYFDAI
jgi:hypothetical protein